MPLELVDSKRVKTFQTATNTGNSLKRNFITFFPNKMTQHIDKYLNQLIITTQIYVHNRFCGTVSHFCSHFGVAGTKLFHRKACLCEEACPKTSNQNAKALQCLLHCSSSSFHITVCLNFLVVTIFDNIASIGKILSLSAIMHFSNSSGSPLESIFNAIIVFCLKSKNQFTQTQIDCNVLRLSADGFFFDKIYPLFGVHFSNVQKKINQYGNWKRAINSKNAMWRDRPKKCSRALRGQVLSSSFRAVEEVVTRASVLLFIVVPVKFHIHIHEETLTIVKSHFDNVENQFSSVFK